MWTDEKHSLFLEHLEFSFVKQLHQSISLLPRCLDQDEGDRSIRQVDQINACETSEQLASPQHGCGEKSKCNRRDHLSHVSDDPLAHIKSPRVYRCKRIRTECPVASARTPESLALCSAGNFVKVVKARGSDTCSHKLPAIDSSDSTKEGTGQNFTDEDNGPNSKTKSRVKRLKTVARCIQHQATDLSYS